MSAVRFRPQPPILFKLKSLSLYSRVNTLQRYLLKRVFVTLVAGTFVLGFILFLGNTLKQILELVISGVINASLLGQMLLYLIPFVIMYAVPIAMLTAVLLVFGSFSAENELTAARTSGISLISLVWPVLLLGLLVSILNIFIITDYGPKVRAQYKELLAQSRTRLAESLLPERRFITQLPGLIIYIGKSERGQIKDILLYFTRDQTNIFAKLRAPEGSFVVTNDLLELRLKRVRGVIHANEQWYPAFFSEWIWRTNFSTNTQRRGVGLRHMSAVELIAQIQKLRTMEKPSNHPNTQQDELNMTLPLRVQLHRQLAFGFAGFAFTLVGIPLGVFMHRRETSISASVAILIVLVYYVMMSAAETFDSRPNMHPELLIWLPNFLLQTIGIILLIKANK